MRWDYWRLLAVVSFSGFIGLILGHMLLFLFLGTLLYTLWLQYQWMQLWHWIRKPKRYSPPYADGIIDEVCWYIQSVYKQNRRRKKKLSLYLKRFQAITASLPDAVVVLGEFGKVEWANKSAQRLLGIRWPKDSHVRVHNLIRHPEFSQLVKAPMRDDNVVVVPSPRNQDIQLELKIVPYIAGGRLLIARDVSKTVKLQQMRKDFVANVSHELRTPLTVLHGYLHALDAQSSAEQWQMVLPVMRQQAERMRTILSDLLALSRLETGEKILRQEPVNMAQLLATIVEDAQQLSEYQQHKIELQLHTDKGLLADREELRSAISNLVFNAVKYTPRGCEIQVRWALTEAGAEVAVIDAGEGIAAHHLERLTERFYRVDKGRSQDKGGTGLGLAIVKHCLQRLDAHLDIHSEEGVGSRFVCCFPKERVIVL